MTIGSPRNGSDGGCGGCVVDGRGMPSLCALRPEGLLDLHRDRSGPVIAHHPPIDAACRHHAAGCGGEEVLAGLTGLAGGDLADPGGNAKVCADLNHGFAGDPFQHTGIRRDHDAVDHYEDVEARAFRDVAVAVEQQREISPPIERFELAAGEVSPMEVLCGRIDGVWRYAQGLSDDEMTPSLLDFGAHDPDPGNGEGCDVIARMDRGIGFAGRRTASQAVHRDIGVFQSGERNAAIENRLDVLVAFPGFETELAHRGAKAAYVILEAEKPALPDAHHVISYIRAAVAPIRDWDRSFAYGHVTAVDIGGAAGKKIVWLQIVHAGMSNATTFESLWRVRLAVALAVSGVAPFGVLIRISSLPPERPLGRKIRISASSNPNPSSLLLSGNLSWVEPSVTPCSPKRSNWTMTVTAMTPLTAPVRLLMPPTTSMAIVMKDRLK